MKNLFCIILVLVIPGLAFCQDYNYSRYDIKDGLAGSTVYCVTQDKEGFLWFGTETGLSRFDGTHFKNFFKKDGLADNEVIQVYSDLKGRVWIAPFKKAISYYYRGKIYNKENDPILKKLDIREHVVRVSEDMDGNILLQEPNCLHLLEPNGKVTKISHLNGKALGEVCTAAPNKNGGFWVTIDDRLFHFKNNQFTEKHRIIDQSTHFTCAVFAGEQYVWRSVPNRVYVGMTDTAKRLNFSDLQPLNRLSGVSDSQVAVCTPDGALLFDVNRPSDSDTLLPGKSVTSVFLDREGNYWLTTKGEGVHRLNSPNVKTLKTGVENRSRQIFSLARYRQWVLAGSDVDLIHKFDPNTGKLQSPPIPPPIVGSGPIVILQPLPDNRLVFSTGHLLFSLTPKLETSCVGYYLFDKCVYPYNAENLLVATTKNLFVMGIDNLMIYDTIWHERTTAVLASHDTIYIGTVDGLHCRLPDKRAVYLGKAFPVLANRIIALAKDANNVLWIATSGEGVVGYKDGKIVAHFVAEKGLTSNLCRCLFINGNILWVGTDRGVNRIDLARADRPIQKYTTGDGLASDVINAVYVDSNKVFIATPAGVTFFDELNLKSESRCDLVFTDISINGRHGHQWRETPLLIPHNDNNVRFDYVGISFKSAGDVRYRYRLVGLDSTWRETRETFLSYPTLPSGEYTLQLQAINKFEVASQLLTTSFTIEQLLWEKTWFRIVAGIVFLCITGLLVWTIVRRIRKREEEKTAVNKRIGDLEQLARKAQMNPHFIFNSLNSIQQYVIDSDITGANKFISGFSRLIRQTLDFSSRKDISLEEELDYLSNYLELEKTRLEDAFTWEIIVKDGIHPADYYIPPMLMQPFVENSVRHGLRFRRDTNGKVDILIEKHAEALVCVIEDNGIGRKAAMQLKSNSHIEYQSRGMSLTAERISMWNKDHAAKITMRIDDLVDDADNALGTRVTLTFPIS